MISATEEGTPFMDRSHSRARSGLHHFAVASGIALLSGLAAACGSDSNDLDPTPPRGHGHIEIGSSSPESGALAMELPFTTVEVTESAEVGDLTLWADSNPGVATIEEEEHGLYPLPEGVPVSLEITALDEGVRFKFGDTTIDEVGESVLIGPAPFHTSGEWQVVLPQGVHDGEYALSFRFTTTTPPYAPSEESTLLLIPTEGGHGDDDHG
jgi:hypothetical protein